MITLEAFFSLRDHHCPDHDNHQHSFERDPAQDSIRQSHRHVPHGLLRVRLPGSAGICLCQLHLLRKRSSDAEEAGREGTEGEQ